MPKIDANGHLHDASGQYTDKPVAPQAAGAVQLDSSLEPIDPDAMNEAQSRFVERIAEQGGQVGWSPDDLAYVVKGPHGTAYLTPPYGEEEPDETAFQDVLDRIEVGAMTYGEWADGREDQTGDAFLEEREMSLELRRALGDQGAHDAMGLGDRGAHWLGDSDAGDAEGRISSEKWVGIDPELNPIPDDPAAGDYRTFQELDLSDAEPVAEGDWSLEDDDSARVLADRVDVAAEIVGMDGRGAYIYGVRVTSKDDPRRSAQIPYTASVVEAPTKAAILSAFVRDAGDYDALDGPDHLADQFGYDPEDHMKLGMTWHGIRSSREALDRIAGPELARTALYGED